MGLLLQLRRRLCCGWCLKNGIASPFLQCIYICFEVNPIHLSIIVLYWIYSYQLTHSPIWINRAVSRWTVSIWICDACAPCVWCWHTETHTHILVRTRSRRTCKIPHLTIDASDRAISSWNGCYSRKRKWDLVKDQAENHLISSPLNARLIRICGCLHKNLTSSYKNSIHAGKLVEWPRSLPILEAFMAIYK